jgi:hypothetical protein
VNKEHSFMSFKSPCQLLPSGVSKITFFLGALGGEQKTFFYTLQVTLSVLSSGYLNKLILRCPWWFKKAIPLFFEKKSKSMSTLFHPAVL